MQFVRCFLFIACLLSAATGFAQSGVPVPPISATGTQGQLYAGYHYVRTDYVLRPATGTSERAVMNGVTVEYSQHFWNHFSYVASFNYGSGTPMQEKLATAAGGVGCTLRFKHVQPFVRVLGGGARLSSHHDAGAMYLSPVNTGGLLILGAGADVTVGDHWGVRPISLQAMYLPFGSSGSRYFTLGAGLLYRFNTRSRR